MHSGLKQQKCLPWQCQGSDFSDKSVRAKINGLYGRIFLVAVFGVENPLNCLLKLPRVLFKAWLVGLLFFSKNITRLLSSLILPFPASLWELLWLPPIWLAKSEHTPHLKILKLNYLHNYIAILDNKYKGSKN